MKNPLRGKRTRARELLARMDRCEGQLEALMDMRGHRGIEKVTGPLDLETLVSLQTSLRTSRWDLEPVANLSTGEIVGTSPAEVDRRFAAKEETKASIAREIGKTGGLRGMVGLHGKNEGRRICAEVIDVLQAGYRLSGKHRDPVIVSDPFDKPFRSPDLSRPGDLDPG